MTTYMRYAFPMALVVIGLVIGVPLCQAQSEPSDKWTVTKTVKWSLLDRIAVALCEAEREDCHSDIRCGLPSLGMLTNCTLQFLPEPWVWTSYREKARKALEAIQ